MIGPTEDEQRKIDAAARALGLGATTLPDSTGRAVVWFHSDGQKRAALTLFEVSSAVSIVSMVAHHLIMFGALAIALARVVKREGPSWLWCKADPRAVRDLEARIVDLLQREHDDTIRGALLCYRVRLVVDIPRRALDVTIEPQ